MNAPYDRERQGPDPYVQDAYASDPYRDRDLAAQDPVKEALRDRAEHPPPPPPAAPEPLYRQPPPPRHAPDPQRWAPPPAPEPDGPSRHLPYGDEPSTVQFTGIDELITRAPDDDDRDGPVPRKRPDDAFAHLYRDQQLSPQPPPQSQQPQSQQPQQPAQPPAAPPPPPSMQPEQTVAPQAPRTAPEAAPPGKSGGGGGGGILKSSAIMAAGTLVSRLTGFLRTLVITAALGAALLGDSYTVAYTLPTMIYMLSIGGGLNSVFVPQLVRAMKNDADGGVAYANRLLTLVMVILGALVALSVLVAPLLIKMLSVPIANNPDANNVAVTFARYCLPTIFFMGVHVVMGQILNARGRFGAMMWTPVLNNVVIICTFGAFLWVYGAHRSSQLGVDTITPEGVRLLGIGTLLGLVVQSLAMIPYLKAAGFSFRPRFDWKGHGLGKAAKLAKWTILFVLANQAGLIVVTQLATAAGASAAEAGNEGAGILGYNNALLIWQMPQAIITVSVMAALLPRLSRSAHDGDLAAVRDDLSHGLRTSAVAIVPIAFAFLALGVPMCLVLYAATGPIPASSMGFILMAFGLGLIPYSVQYVVLRAFYAYEDTRTPFYNTVLVAAGNAAGAGLCYLLLPSRWAVAGMAACYGLAYAFGVIVAWKRLSAKLEGDLDGGRIARTYARLTLASLPAAALAGGAAYASVQTLGNGLIGGAVGVIAGSLVMGVVFVLTAKRLRIQELTAMVGMVRAKLGR
ncbi:murein biosynthesis integral membrane protein MurJ [Streptomyces sp. 549]|uniref:murein biosynthesis integral membrane protein MurJ n=1 Tax=Streptomyces sp. 549 TaxID=3049076 RepID=UPI0024C42002|nr:murein biosynthesis integral membrane protein MurJ [Streptomyces sp. 549]